MKSVDVGRGTRNDRPRLASMKSEGKLKTRSRWWATRDRLLTPKAIAYHEAGHVVVAFEFGWWVRRGGVRLGAWAHARLRHRKADYTVLGTSENMLLARACISMAGLLTEQKFHGLKWRLERDVVQEIRAVRAGKSEGAYLDPSDLRAVALALLDDDPPINLAGARRVVIYCQEYTEALLDDPRVWAGAERLAKALHRRRYLSPRAVKQVLGDAFFADAGRMIRDSHGHRLAEASPRRLPASAPHQWRSDTACG
jgi:hypothetical protein